jgi:hypothetical protein
MWERICETKDISLVNAILSVVIYEYYTIQNVRTRHFIKPWISSYHRTMVH